MSRTLVIRKGAEWGRVSRAITTEDKVIPNSSTRALRRLARRRAEIAKERVRSLPVRGSSGRSTGLRQRVAAGVFVEDVPNGARVRTSMVQRDEAIIPRGLDRAQGWRHPVFGNREVWVRQRPLKTGWFTGTFEDAQGPAEDELEDILERSVQAIAAQGSQRPPI